jgi:hypothetical protein
VNGTKRGGFAGPRGGRQRRTMSDADRRLVTRALKAISERTEAQEEILAAILAARWSASDRHDPAAIEWLSRWTPKPAHLITPACTCAAGSCGVCS